MRFCSLIWRRAPRRAQDFPEIFLRKIPRLTACGGI